MRGGDDTSFTRYDALVCWLEDVRALSPFVITTRAKQRRRERNAFQLGLDAGRAGLPGDVIVPPGLTSPWEKSPRRHCT